MALTQEQKSDIRSAVDQILTARESKYHERAINELQNHREFMFKISRWVVLGFFGLLFIFGVFVSFFFQHDLAGKASASLAQIAVDKEIDKRISSLINPIANEITQSSRQKIVNTADEATKEAVEKIQRAIKEEFQGQEKSEITKLINERLDDINNQDLESLINSAIESNKITREHQEKQDNSLKEIREKLTNLHNLQEEFNFKRNLHEVSTNQIIVNILSLLKNIAQDNVKSQNEIVSILVSLHSGDVTTGSFPETNNIHRKTDIRTEMLDRLIQSYQ